MRADLLVISDTWKDAAASVNIDNFHLVQQLPCERGAAGVAVEKRNNFALHQHSGANRIACIALRITACDAPKVYHIALLFARTITTF